MNRCDHCGPLDWTINAYGCIAHKHDCPRNPDSFCQAHPRGCDLVADQRGLTVRPIPMMSRETAERLGR